MGISSSWNKFPLKSEIMKKKMDDDEIFLAQSGLPPSLSRYQ
jgi:hypothetical protein